MSASQSQRRVLARPWMFAKSTDLQCNEPIIGFNDRVKEGTFFLKENFKVSTVLTKYVKVF